MSARLVPACMLPLLATFSGASYAFAQSSDEPEPPQKLVKHNVAATKKKSAAKLVFAQVLFDVDNDPVTDLKTSDIRVRENGKPREVVLLRFAGSQGPTTAAGEFTNRSLMTPTVVLLDRLNGTLSNAAAASKGLGDVLQRMQSVNRVYIYSLTNHGDLFPVEPLPGTKPDSNAAPEPSAAELRSKLDDATRRLNGLRGKDYESSSPPGMRWKMTFQALSALVSEMASIAGRKNLIWVTRGEEEDRQFQWVVLTPSQFRRLSGMALGSGVAISTLDQAGPGADPVGLQQLTTLSDVTGGSFYAASDTEPAIAQAMIDSRSSYTIAYYSPPGEKQGKERKIRVDSVRKGVSVHLLKSEGAADADPDELEPEAFDAEARSSFDATEIRQGVTGSRDPGTGTVHFDIRVDPADVLIEHRGENYQARLSMMFAAYGESAQWATWPAAPADVNLTPDQFQKASTDGIVVSRSLRLDDQRQRIRVMVFDRGLHGIGSVTIPVSEIVVKPAQ